MSSSEPPGHVAPALPPTGEQEIPDVIPLQLYSPINWLLILCSVALTVRTNFGQEEERVFPWLISLAPANSPARLAEVFHGEVWRLLTPAFLHGSVMHLGFNMLNLMTLGNLLERRIRSWHYLTLVLSVALGSTLGEYFISGSQLFGGMSGVVYGLFGYIWLRSRSDRTFGLEIPAPFIVMALAWLLLCFTGLFGPIANAAHVVGLLLGALWGILDGRGSTRQTSPNVVPS